MDSQAFFFFFFFIFSFSFLVFFFLSINEVNFVSTPLPAPHIEFSQVFLLRSFAQQCNFPPLAPAAARRRCTIINHDVFLLDSLLISNLTPIIRQSDCLVRRNLFELRSAMASEAPLYRTAFFLLPPPHAFRTPTSRLFSASHQFSNSGEELPRPFSFVF